MALNDIRFVLGQGLGRPLPNTDHYSAFVFYNNTLPSGFSTTDRIKEVFSISDAEDLGITVATHPVEHYHISEFFRLQPKGYLWVGIYAEPVTFDGTEIQTVQDYAEGKVKQFGVFLQTETFATSQITAIQVVVDAITTDHKPAEVLFHADCTGLSLATLSDLSTLSAKNVSFILGQDGAGTGAALAVAEGYSISNLGAALGTVALAAVYQNIGWVQRFNISDGTENEVAAFATGDLFNDQSTALLEALNDKNYIFSRKHVGINGTYYQDSWTAIAKTNDFVTVENNRTINKARRLVRTNLLPLLNSPLYVDPDTGYLSESTIAIFENEVARAVEQMERDAEISGYQVVINPEQNVLSTSKIVITLEIIPVGVARTIEVNLSFVLKLS